MKRLPRTLIIGSKAGQNQLWVGIPGLGQLEPVHVVCHAPELLEV